MMGQSGGTGMMGQSTGTGMMGQLDENGLPSCCSGMSAEDAAACARMMGSAPQN